MRRARRRTFYCEKKKQLTIPRLLRPLFPGRRELLARQIEQRFVRPEERTVP
ncbi:MAG TPA: hypothetical protein VGL15_15220 [Vicinamibacteria bacterium]